MFLSLPLSSPSPPRSFPSSFQIIHCLCIGGGAGDVVVLVGDRGEQLLRVSVALGLSGEQLLMQLLHVGLVLGLSGVALGLSGVALGLSGEQLLMQLLHVGVVLGRSHLLGLSHRLRGRNQGRQGLNRSINARLALSHRPTNKSGQVIYGFYDLTASDG